MYVYTWGDVSIENSIIRFNEVTEDGGGLYVQNAERLNVHGLTVEGNSAYHGGGVYVTGVREVHFKASSIRENEVTRSGGGLYIRNCGSLNLSDNDEIANNRTGGSLGIDDGGGIYVEDCAELELDHNVIRENIAENAQGGGVYVRYSSGQCRVEKCGDPNQYSSGQCPLNREPFGCKAIFRNNVVTANTADDGGGVFVSGVTNPSCRIEPADPAIPWWQRGACDEEGFALSNGDYGIWFEGNTLQGNLATSSGGAIDIEDSDYTSLIRNRILENKARGQGALEGGGGLHVHNVKGELGAFGTLEIGDSNLSGNTSQQNGGGILSYWVQTVRVLNNVIRGNTAAGTDDANDYRGGGLYVKDYVKGKIEGNLIEGNVASEGGGLYASMNETIRNDEPILHEQAFDELDQISLVDNRIYQNRAEGGGDGTGGGVYFYAPYRVTLRGNRIRGNSADNEGAGIYVHNAGAYRVWRKGPGAVRSPIAGTVNSIDVKNGQHVEEGELVATIQAEGTQTLTPVFAHRAGEVQIDGYAQEGYKLDEKETVLAIGGQANTTAVIKCMGGATIETNRIVENAITGVGDGARDVCTHKGLLTVEEKSKDRLSGAGLKVYLSYSTTLSKNHIEDNMGAEKGGGAAIERPLCDVTIDDNFVSGNAGQKGGGVYVFQYGGQPTEVMGNALLNLMDPNTAQSAEVDNPLIIVNNLMYANQAQHEGGGLYLCTTRSSRFRYAYDNENPWKVVTEDGRATAILTNNTISANEAAEGGGIWLMQGSSSTTASLFNNVIWDNKAGNTGADVWLDAPRAIWRSNDVGQLPVAEPANITDMDVSNTSEDPVFLTGLGDWSPMSWTASINSPTSILASITHLPSRRSS